MHIKEKYLDFTSVLNENINVVVSGLKSLTD